MTDDAQVTFGAPVGPGALSFTDSGYMPVSQLTIAGSPQSLKGNLDRLLIPYSGAGLQHFAMTGAPTETDYTSLHYELIGYKGSALFGQAADGTPTVSGVDHLKVLAQGDLIAGQLAFQPNGGISGDVNLSYQVGGQTLGTIDLTVQHTAGDIGPTASGFTLSGGALHATFTPTSA